MSCILTTARGAVWAEHLAGVGVDAEGALQVLTVHGHSHPLGVSYSGDRLPAVTSALLAAIDLMARSAARNRQITTVLYLDHDLVIHVQERHAATGVPKRAIKDFQVQHAAAGTSPEQGDDQPPPDTDGDTFSGLNGAR